MIRVARRGREERGERVEDLRVARIDGPRGAEVNHRIVAPSEVPADVRAAASGDWVSAWIRLTAERLLSYADESALPQRP